MGVGALSLQLQRPKHAGNTTISKRFTHESRCAVLYRQRRATDFAAREVSSSKTQPLRPGPPSAMEGLLQRASSHSSSSSSSSSCADGGGHARSGGSGGSSGRGRGGGTAAALCRLGTLLLLAVVAQCRNPTLPMPITGMTSCTKPIGGLKCVRETRNFFVAGVGLSLGTGYNFKSLCSDAGINVGWLQGIPWQQNFDMSSPTSANFPKTPGGAPDLRYFYPAGASISQMIVLHAANPWGPQWGTVPAIIFVYQTQAGLDFAVCGNADYADFYLNPRRTAPPPTLVTLKAQYSNPLSQEKPARFLSDFAAECSIRGSGYHGGDPNKMSRYHLKHVNKVCWAPYTPFVSFRPQPVVPPVINKSKYNASAHPYQPCFYDKKASKHGGAGTSWSCALSGLSIATGKYSAIHIGDKGTALEWQPEDNGSDGNASKYVQVAAEDVFMGSDYHEGDSVAAPEGDPVTPIESLKVVNGWVVAP